MQVSTSTEVVESSRTIMYTKIYFCALNKVMARDSCQFALYLSLYLQFNNNFFTRNFPTSTTKGSPATRPPPTPCPRPSARCRRDTSRAPTPSRRSCSPTSPATDLRTNANNNCTHAIYVSKDTGPLPEWTLTIARAAEN